MAVVFFWTEVYVRLFAFKVNLIRIYVYAPISNKYIYINIYPS